MHLGNHQLVTSPPPLLRLPQGRNIWSPCLRAALPSTNRNNCQHRHQYRLHCRHFIGIYLHRRFRDSSATHPLLFVPWFPKMVSRALFDCRANRHCKPVLTASAVPLSRCHLPRPHLIAELSWQLWPSGISRHKNALFAKQRFVASKKSSLLFFLYLHQVTCSDVQLCRHCCFASKVYRFSHTSPV